MSKKESKLLQISNHFYQRGLNLTGGIKTTPSEEGIEENSLIDILNIGTQLSDGSLYIRASFRGSKKYFQIPIKTSDFKLWMERVNILHLESIEDMDKDEYVDDLDF